MRTAVDRVAWTSDVVRGVRVGVAVTCTGGATCAAVVAVAWMSAATPGVAPVAPRSHAESRNPASTTPGTSTRNEAMFLDRPSSGRSPFLPTAPSLWDVLGGRHRANVTAGGGRKVLEALVPVRQGSPAMSCALACGGRTAEAVFDRHRCLNQRSLLAPNVHYGEGHAAKPLVLRLPVRPGVRRPGRGSPANLLWSAWIGLDDPVDGEA